MCHNDLSTIPGSYGSKRDNAYYLSETFGVIVVNKFQNLNYDKMGKERIKREHDLLKLNCVSDSEFESRMAVWDRMALSSAPLGEAKNFIEATFNKLQNDVVNASRDFQVSFSDFEAMAKDEINYIRINVADQKTQFVWYAIITLMVAGTVAICM